VAQPIEEAVNGVDKMLYMSSQSSGNGSYQLTVTFEIGTDPDMNMVNVQNRLKKVESSLPDEVTRIGVDVDKSASGMLKAFSFYSPDDSLDNLTLSNWVTANVIDTVSRIPGVGNVINFGSPYSMRVWMDTSRMAKLGLTPADIITALRAQNIQAAVGEVGATPTNGRQELHFTLDAQGRLTTPEQFGEVVIRTNDGGGILRLKDVAEVALGKEGYDVQGFFNGKPASGIMVSQSAGSNAVAVVNQLNRTLEEMSSRFPPGMAYDTVFDATTFVRASIYEVEHTIVVAFILVIIVVYLFLGNWRSTLIPMIAVPVSLVGTFAVLLAVGFSANTISLLAMVLAIGIVVDDAIVVVENVERVMEQENLPPPGSQHQGHAGNNQPHHRHHPGSSVGLHPGGFHPRRLRQALPAVRRHHLRFHFHLGHQRPDPLSGPLRRFSEKRAQPETQFHRSQISGLHGRLQKQVRQLGDRPFAAFDFRPGDGSGFPGFLLRHHAGNPDRFSAR